jgi:mannitol PTS system EIIA component
MAKPDLSTLLNPRSVLVDCTAVDRDDAIRQAGGALVDAGAVGADYVDAMIERENSVSTYVGEGVAIPHATLSDADVVTAEALSFLRFPGGVDWNGNLVTIVIGIAARGNGHIALLSQLATVLLNPHTAESLRSASSADDVRRLIDGREVSPNSSLTTASKE